VDSFIASDELESMKVAPPEKALEKLTEAAVGASNKETDGRSASACLVSVASHGAVLPLPTRAHPTPEGATAEPTEPAPEETLQQTQNQSQQPPLELPRFDDKVKVVEVSREQASPPIAGKTRSKKRTNVASPSSSFSKPAPSAVLSEALAENGAKKVSVDLLTASSCSPRVESSATLPVSARSNTASSHQSSPRMDSIKEEQRSKKVAKAQKDTLVLSLSSATPEDVRRVSQAAAVEATVDVATPPALQLPASEPQQPLQASQTSGSKPRSKKASGTR